MLSVLFKVAIVSRGHENCPPNRHHAVFLPIEVIRDWVLEKVDCTKPGLPYVFHLSASYPIILHHSLVGHLNCLIENLDFPLFDFLFQCKRSPLEVTL